MNQENPKVMREVRDFNDARFTNLNSLVDK